MALTLIVATIAPASAEPAGIAALVYPMFSPNMANPESCSQTTISVTKQNGTEFAAGEWIDVRYMLPDNEPVALQNGIWSLPQLPAGGRQLVQREVRTNALPKTVGVPFSLCAFMLQGGLISGTVTKVRLKITLYQGAAAVQPLETEITLLPRTAETDAIERVRETCHNKAFESNLVVVQVKKSSRVGGQNKIIGTLFRRGLPSPNDAIELHASSANDSAPIGAVLDATTTNAKGAFEFSFPMESPGKYGFAVYEVVAHERTVPIGPVLGPFPAFAFDLYFNVKKGGAYERGLTDWIPRQSAACMSAYGQYSAYANRPDRVFNDDRHPLLVYAAQKVFAGSKGKRAYASNVAWKAATGGRCFVGWWENQYGQRVSGYSYWCERHSS